MMSLSKRKLAANRANAQKSTGPTTPEGRETVSQNAVKHGLCGHFKVLATESQTEYEALLHRFRAAEKPVDAVDHELVAKMARHTWLATRAVRLQEACFIVYPQTPDQIKRGTESIAVMKDIATYERYHASHDRAYQRASAELARRRKERLSAERGFASQKRAEADAEQREERQQQRRETHPYRVAAAKHRWERHLQHPQAPQTVTPQPTEPQNTPADSPQTQKIAA